MDQLNFKNKKVTVAGLGLHGGGAGVARYLVKQKALVTVTDLKNKKELKSSLEKLKGLPIKFVLGKHQKADFVKTDLVIKNPGMPDDSPYLKLAHENKIPIDTDLGLFLGACPSRNIIGITGTKGKSTTATLIYLILKQENKNTQIAGNIRISPFEILKKIKHDTPVVLELSSWQLEGLASRKWSPHIACITNIFPDHLNRYQNMQKYAEAKKNIFKFQKQGDCVIMNYDNPILRNPRFYLNLKNIYWFSRQEKVKQGSFLRNGRIMFLAKNLKCDLAGIDNLKLLGTHNLENILAAVTTAWIYGVKRTSIQKVLKEFRGLDSRLELTRKFQGVEYYNDTTSTTPTSTIAALNAFQKPIILIAGGADKNLDFSKLAQAVTRKVKTLILLGGDATLRLKKEIKKYLKKRKQNLPMKTAQSMGEAVKQARSLACQNDIILLSPACASFGMFQNEFDRGEQFEKIVSKLR